MRFVLPILLLFAFSGPAQAGATEKAGTQLPPSVQSQRSLQSPGEDLFLNPGGRLLLTAFREYDYLSREFSDSIMLANRLALNVDIAADEAVEHSVLADERLAEFNLQLQIEGMGETTWPEMIGRLLLDQVLQFGYQYAKERIRAQSLSEMDYLYLPRGPGMVRNFGEVGSAARIRGALQSSQVWRDYYEARKNKISPK